MKPMSFTQSYPFHTAELSDDKLHDEYIEYWSGEDIENMNHVVGVAFRPKEGRIYEFQNPDTHDEYEQLVDPRDGDTLTFDNAIEQSLRGGVFMELQKIMLPAERWHEIRDAYIENTEWSEQWKEATPSMQEHLEDVNREATRQNIEEHGGW